MQYATQREAGSSRECRGTIYRLSDIPWEVVNLDPDTEADAGLDFSAWLTATVDIGGTLHHLEAIEVEDDGGWPTPVAPELSEYHWRLVSAYQPDSPMETTVICGRKYHVFLQPYCR